MQPRRPRRILLGIVATTALALTGAAVVELRANAGIASMQEVARDLQCDWDARPHSREVLWGSSYDDRAFDHYDHALARAVPLLQRNSELVELWQARHRPATAAHDALRAQWAPLVETMQRGAHATDIRALPAGAPPTHVTNLLTARWITNFAVDAAERALDAGEPRRAVERTLDALTFGHDIVRRGALIDQMVGGALLAIVAEAWTDAQLARLDGASRQLLADGLARLDRLLDPAVDGIGELVTTLRSVAGALPGSGYAPSLEAWAFGFSNRWMFADAFVHTTSFVRALERERKRPWPQRQALIQLELQELTTRHQNPMLAMLVPAYDAVERNRREVVAMVRLLRMAVALHQGVSQPPLADPLGDGAIAVGTDGAVTHLRCVGSDERRNLARTVTPRH